MAVLERARGARSFGARGNGIDDDAPLLQAAIDAGGYVHLSGGTYLIGSTLQMRDNVVLEGIGTGTTLKAKNSLNADIISSAGSGNVFFAAIRNMRIDGNKANNSSGHCINMLRAHTWRVEDLHVKDAADRAVNIEGDASFFALNNWLVRCRLESSNNTTLKIGAFAPNNHIRDCIVGGSTNFSCMEIQNDETIITGCHVHTAAAHGINVNSDNCILLNNIIESSGQHGIFLESTALGTRVTGNQSFNNGLTAAGDGINVAGSDTTLMGNRCYDTQGTKTQDYGIQLTAASARVLVIGNSARAGENQTGDILDGGTGNTLANNQIT